MKLRQITEEFETSPAGTDAFAEVKKGMLSLIASDAPHAAAYFQVYGYARNYVILHDDEAIPPEFAQGSKVQLLSYMKAIEAAIPAGPAALLAALSANVVDYLNSSKPF
jgi:hypothetical protein